MKTYLYVNEGLYSGYHGIYSHIVSEEINTAKEASECAEELGWDLIYSYGLEEEYEEDGEYWEENVEFNWNCYKICDNVNKTIKELERLACDLGPELFIEEYCDKKFLF